MISSQAASRGAAACRSWALNLQAEGRSFCYMTDLHHGQKTACLKFALRLVFFSS